MDKKTVLSNPLANAAALLALMISRGIIRYARVSASVPEEKKDDVNVITKKILKRLTQQTIDGKKISDIEREQLTNTLTKINEAYPDTKPDEKVSADSVVARNITALSGINMPKYVTIPDAQPVTLPQSLATNMQNEIFTRRGQTADLERQTADLEQARQTEIRGRALIKGKYKAKVSRLEEEKKTLMEQNEADILRLEQKIE